LTPFGVNARVHPLFAERDAHARQAKRIDLILDGAIDNRPQRGTT
jgi:hypothetical protein